MAYSFGRFVSLPGEGMQSAGVEPWVDELLALIGSRQSPIGTTCSVSDARLLQLKRTSIALTTHSPMICRDFRGRARGNAASLLLLFSLSGVMRARLPGAELHLCPSRGALLVEGRRPAILEHGIGRRLTIGFDRMLLDGWIDSRKELHGRLLFAPAGLAILRVVAQSLVRHGANMQPGDLRLADEHFGLLLARVLAETPEIGAYTPLRRDTTLSMSGATVQQARIEGMKAYILARLAQTTLDLANVAQAHGISVPYARSLFNREGVSFTAWLRERRLERAAEALADPSRREVAISATAFGCGFNDLSYFNRRFRARYGVTPRVYRAQALAQPDELSKRPDQERPEAR